MADLKGPEIDVFTETQDRNKSRTKEKTFKILFQTSNFLINYFQK